MEGGTESCTVPSDLHLYTNLHNITTAQHQSTQIPEVTTAKIRQKEVDQEPGPELMLIVVDPTVNEVAGSLMPGPETEEGHIRPQVCVNLIS
ncbi:hypothetical protein STEG23_016390 [Scotinomys teguina]